jgi:hypothetical protein
MGTTLFSAAAASRFANISPDTLRSLLLSGQFSTDHFAKNTKTQERTFYFSQTDLNRLAAYVADRTTGNRTDLAAD